MMLKEDILIKVLDHWCKNTFVKIFVFLVLFDGETWVVFNTQNWNRWCHNKLTIPASVYRSILSRSHVVSGDSFSGFLPLTKNTCVRWIENSKIVRGCACECESCVCVWPCDELATRPGWSRCLHSETAGTGCSRPPLTLSSGRGGHWNWMAGWRDSCCTSQNTLIKKE